MRYNKISIIGISGSGKTTLANVVSKLLNLPVFHIDLLFSNENGEHATKSEFDKKHTELINMKEWIIEGYIEEGMVDRLQRSDLIIHLKYSRFIVLIRFIKRWLQNLFKDELAFPEVTFLGFLIKVFIEPVVMTESRKIKKTLKHVDPEKIITIKTSNELAMFVSEGFKKSNDHGLKYIQEY